MRGRFDEANKLLPINHLSVLVNPTLGNHHNDKMKSFWSHLERWLDLSRFPSWLKLSISLLSIDYSAVSLRGFLTPNVLFDHPVELWFYLYIELLSWFHHLNLRWGFLSNNQNWKQGGSLANREGVKSQDCITAKISLCFFFLKELFLEYKSLFW